MLSRRSLIALLSGAGIGLVALRPAFAHAVVTASYPERGAAIPSGPLDVWVDFNTRIDVERSRLALIAADDSTKKIPRIDTDDANRLAGHLDDIRPGEYRLHWQVLSRDGHITRGDIAFSVAF